MTYQFIGLLPYADAAHRCRRHRRRSDSCRRWRILERRRTRTVAFRNRFGSEYDRAVHTHGSVNEAESKLAARKPALKLSKFANSHTERERFVTEWSTVQFRFVDHPKAAVIEADDLINALLEARGYPRSTFEQRAADVSVHYPRVMENYRAAHLIAVRPARSKPPPKNCAPQSSSIATSSTISSGYKSPSKQRLPHRIESSGAKENGQWLGPLKGPWHVSWRSKNDATHRHRSMHSQAGLFHLDAAGTVALGGRFGIRPQAAFRDDSGNLLSRRQHKQHHADRLQLLPHLPTCRFFHWLFRRATIGSWPPRYRRPKRWAMQNCRALTTTSPSFRWF